MNKFHFIDGFNVSPFFCLVLIKPWWSGLKCKDNCVLTCSVSGKCQQPWNDMNTQLVGAFGSSWQANHTIWPHLNQPCLQLVSNFSTSGATVDQRNSICGCTFRAIRVKYSYELNMRRKLENLDGWTTWHGLERNCGVLTDPCEICHWNATWPPSQRANPAGLQRSWSLCAGLLSYRVAQEKEAVDVLRLDTFSGCSDGSGRDDLSDLCSLVSLCQLQSFPVVLSIHLLIRHSL